MYTLLIIVEILEKQKKKLYYWGLKQIKKIKDK